MYTTRTLVHALAGVDDFTNWSIPTFWSRGLECLDTEAVLQTEACQDALQFGHFKPLNEKSVRQSEQQSLRASLAPTRIGVALIATNKVQQQLVMWHNRRLVRTGGVRRIILKRI